MLEVKDLTFSYDGMTQVLRSINFKINRGEIVTITGPTGSGKSTLAKCMSGFIPRSIKGAFSGTILIDEMDMSKLSLAEISKKVSLVQQDPDSQICTLKVADEVAFGPENYGFELELIKNLVDSTLSEVDSTHLQYRPTFAISGGEKQRVTIAAMLACQPDYLILDEPSSSLDPKGILSLQKILSGLKARNVGVICIEHNLEAVRPISDRILAVSDGEISTWKFSEIPARKDIRKHILREDNCLLLMKNINFSYGLRKVIQNVELGIHKGEIIALMGENGSGKTTLVSLLGGLLTPDTGEIYLEEVPLHDMGRKEITKKLSIVFQNPNHQIFERTVWREQNLTMDILGHQSSEDYQRANDLLEDANLASMKERNPFSLSHGQKRRLNVSSVSVHSPHILLFDEPFIGQDFDGRNFILNILIDTANDGGASLVVTHDSNFAKNHCDRVIFIENGSILLDGSPELVFKRLKEMNRIEFASLEVG
jgi:energy-coupling factor transporter ATP-binding protein EcfA2